MRGSIGISILEGGSSASADELIRDADAAMYIAKRDGKGGYRLFEPEMHAGVLARLELRARPAAGARGRPVRAALPADRAARRRPGRGDRGAAALAPPRARAGGPRGLHPVRRGDRADRPDRPLGAARGVPPGGGDPAAVDDDDPPLYMCVNLSVKQLQHSDVISDVSDALADSGLRSETAHARDHRVDADRRPRHRRGQAQRAARARRAHRDGRLRHRLLLAQLPQPLPGRRHQDGPLVPAPGAPRRRRSTSPAPSSRSAARSRWRSSPRASSSTSS